MEKMEEKTRRSRPVGVRARVCSRKRDWRMANEADSDANIVSSPLISTSRALRSVRSALPMPRMEPSAWWKKDSRGGFWSDIFRSSACSRARLTASMSAVASSPACWRAMSVSVTGRGREKRCCHGALTAAKPERSDMREMPITPTRSRHASVRRSG